MHCTTAGYGVPTSSNRIQDCALCPAGQHNNAVWGSGRCKNYGGNCANGNLVAASSRTQVCKPCVNSMHDARCDTLQGVAFRHMAMSFAQFLPFRQIDAAVYTSFVHVLALKQF